MRRLMLGSVLVVGALALPSGAPGADRDCSDFEIQREAQDYFESKGGPASDPDRLDGDGDGRACVIYSG